ncbi:2Fe-2S iron-sulfur cluster-binding protein [Streptomyces sp. HNS054]|uniref:2Fe-2S iron-sulfur cluster-binding protein n=1 Tax=Streptomyces sp. HNS054 TaxID=1662446 RepID=UPI0006528E68|nr:2Fe-2S iron-sulfur cluster-binding protein [Streptomyces sp. HNS054]WPW19558.1 2Fe-2S iron-sulfur cluster-binding protein [Streptomyces griseoincarnatus]
MTDDQHGQGGTPPGGSRWDPLPQGDYDDGATAFVNLPEGGIDALLDAMESPLAAPGHGYVPPQITVTPATTAGTDPAATGSWAAPGAPVDGAQWHDPASAEPDATAGDPYGYDPGASGQWAYGPDAQGQHDAHGQQHAQDHDAAARHQGHGQAPGQDVTGQWSIPVAGGDLPDESGEFTTSALAEQWGNTPPATLPGGAAAPWAESQSIGTPWGPGVPGVPQDHEQRPGAHVPHGGGYGPGGGDPGQRPGAHGPRPGADKNEEHGSYGPQAGEQPQPGADGQQPGSYAPQGGEHGAAPAYGGQPGGDDQPQARPAAEDAPAHEAPHASRPLPAEEHPEQPWQSDDGADGAGDAEAAGGREHPHDLEGAEEPSSGTSEGDGDFGDTADAQEAVDASEGPSEAPEPSEGDGAPDDADGAGAPEASDEPDAPVADVLVAPHDDHPLASYVLRVNGTDRPVTDAWIGESLLYVLRERLGLAGAKDGCSQGECGACNVQVDGRLVASCLVPAVTAAGSEVRTVEGLAQDGRPSDVQRALARCGAVQCGFCVPGMAMTVHDLLEGNPAPTELETRQALCGNLCRCSGYRGVVNAVQEVVAEREAHAEAEAAADDGDGTPRIPHQAGPGAGGVNPSAFGVVPQDQPHGQDGGQA